MTLECLVCGATLHSHEIKSQQDITFFRLIHENHDNLAAFDKEPEMTAHIETETTVYTVCQPCGIKVLADDHQGAEIWIARHNREAHWEQLVDAAVLIAAREAWDRGFTTGMSRPASRENPYK